MAKSEFEQRSNSELQLRAAEDVGRFPARVPAAVDRLVGVRLRIARQASNLTLVDVAKRVGLSPQQIQKYEIGDSRISAARLFELSVLFQRPVEWFFEEG